MRTGHGKSWTVVCLLGIGCVSPAQRYNERGVALFNSGQYEAAEAEFLQATIQDPLNDDAFYNVASTCHRMGRRMEAQWNYEQCLALNPHHSKCNHALVVLHLEQQRPQEAYASIARWLAIAPGSADPMVEQAWLEQQQGQAEEAGRLLQQALAIEPRHPRALVELAAFYEAAQDRDRALALYQRALALNPAQPDLSRKVADLRGAAPARTPEPAAARRMALNTPSAPKPARDLRYEYR